MANSGTATVSETNTAGITRLKIEWTSTSGGAVRKEKIGIYGTILALLTSPDNTDVPSVDYDITLLDDQALDVLNAAGIDRHTSNEEVATCNIANDTQMTTYGEHALVIASAGSTKKGIIKLYIRGAVTVP